MREQMKQRKIEDCRCAPREQVELYTRAYGPEGQTLALSVLNLSAQGMMAQCRPRLEIGDRIHVPLPVVGSVGAQVRWSRDARFGCQFDSAIDLASFYELLAAIVRDDSSSAGSQ